MPDDYLVPVWRGVPNGNGIGTIGLDPREAEYVLAHGCMIDGEPWRARSGGFSREPQGDGRVTVRLERA